MSHIKNKLRLIVSFGILFDDDDPDGPGGATMRVPIPRINEEEHDHYPMRLDIIPLLLAA